MPLTCPINMVFFHSYVGLPEGHAYNFKIYIYMLWAMWYGFTSMYRHMYRCYVNDVWVIPLGFWASRASTGEIFTLGPVLFMVFMVFMASGDRGPLWGTRSTFQTFPDTSSIATIFLLEFSCSIDLWITFAFSSFATLQRGRWNGPENSLNQVEIAACKWQIHFDPVRWLQLGSLACLSSSVSFQSVQNKHKDKQKWNFTLHTKTNADQHGNK